VDAGLVGMGRTTATGQRARCKTLRLTEPRRSLRKPPTITASDDHERRSLGRIDEGVRWASLDDVSAHVDLGVLLLPTGDRGGRDGLGFVLEVGPDVREGAHSDAAV
jgi:hypothetical protein